MSDKTGGIFGGFSPMPARIVGREREDRMQQVARAINYHHQFLDDIIRAILPHDLIVLGAPTGVGKTDLALSIATSNAACERRVGYFALEAEPLELERRLKYTLLSAAVWRAEHPERSELNYVDWYLGSCDHIVGDFEAQVEREILHRFGGLMTYYRGTNFTFDDLHKAVQAVHKMVDLIVIDHLHYIDTDENQSEARALGELTKSIRDISLVIGKPILVVAHLRKRDARLKQLVATLDDLHGSSNISKIATHVITFEPARVVEAPKWWLAPTFMCVLKDRRAGTTGLVALNFFDRRTRGYEQTYTLGRLTKGGTAWEQLRITDRPNWARGHRALEIEQAEQPVEAPPELQTQIPLGEPR